MKLLNHTLRYFAAALFVIITGWAGLFYYNLLDEIYDSLDDGLENYKILIIKRAEVDSTILHKTGFDEDNYSIKPVAAPHALSFRDIYSDTTMFMENEQDYEPVRMLTTVFRQHNRFYELRVVNTMIETDDLIEDLLYSILWLYLGLIATILLLNNFLLKRIWMPFYSLLQQLRHYRLEKQDTVVFEETNVAEFKELNHAVAKLLQNTTNTYLSQKQFIENASHELQTPLAISLNKLELLLEQNNLTEDQVQLLASSIHNLERMARLNKSLLLISKIENKQFHVEEEINLNQLLQSLAEDFSDQAAFKNITLSVEENGVCQVAMNPDLATILLSNLLKNAIIHNHTGGYVLVKVSPLQLLIENSGKGSSLDTNKMFERFQRDGQNPTSTGLGLPIVKAITALYGFKISYTYQDKHIMRLDLKVK
ncbi:HAMP domain-containing sensor histidine kinase [Pontibacter sp. SGAir0037]|uniref:sensor histidine kinase n=1 Tax=Pontibacter sp. SGAir0037 TaxID=2571030 RepID=UPI0010CD4276|nr:HAMP domain-containing sensor histidine kinase [Pontibacter sp. SGAir0037]QCR22577.1 sensor histidine kinase [Pontibacter sp. SGAir0037]